MTWDHLGRLTAVKDAAGTTTLATYTYDPLDRLRTAADGAGGRIRFRYTGLTTSVAQWWDDVAGTVTRSVGNDWGGERLLDWTGSNSNLRHCYWKYEPTLEGVRFLTSYDYDTRFGTAGRAFDRLVFRPLIGWATAWSIDRLRLWLERGIEPAQSLRQAVVHGIARIGLTGIFLYHGLVPKLLGPDPQEVAMLGDAGIPGASIGTVILVLGITEVLFAVLLLARWDSRLLPVIAAAFAVVSTLIVAVASPRYLGSAFNPVSLNLGVLCLAAIDLVVLPDPPSAGRCRRRPARAAA